MKSKQDVKTAEDTGHRFQYYLTWNAKKTNGT